MKTNSEYKVIKYFMGAYLYQCALEERGSIERIALDFADSEPLDSIISLESELESFINEYPTRQVIIDFGSCYLPKSDDDVVNWLENIRRVLIEKLNNTQVDL